MSLEVNMSNKNKQTKPKYTLEFKHVLSWELSNTMETTFCIDALEKALDVSTPEIFNTDQGAQFTSLSFTKVLLDKEIKISMDGPFSPNNKEKYLKLS
jgi:transposase InsO family protein